MYQYPEGEKPEIVRLPLITKNPNPPSPDAKPVPITRPTMDFSGDPTALRPVERPTFSHPFTPVGQGGFFQITSKGTQDPAYNQWSKDPANKTFFTDPSKPAPTLNPILQGFTDLVGNPKLTSGLQRNPDAQAKLHDVDNILKANAGIFRDQQGGLLEWGTDKDGNPLYSAPELINQKGGHGLGGQQVNQIGSLADALGAFRLPEEAEHFASLTKFAGSKAFQETINQQIAQGDTKGAINEVLKNLGGVNLSNIKDKSQLATAFGAYNLINNWGQMNDAQKAMSLSGLALQSYKFKDGTSLADKVVIPGRDPKDPTLTLGQAMGIAGTGVNVMQLQKNWDQLDALQRITYGIGTASQMVALGKQLGLFGKADMQGAVVQTSAKELGALGFQANPSAGVGAIVGPSSNVPKGYTVVASGTEPNTVIAVPDGHQNTTATINGTNKATTLNTAKGAELASLGALKIYQNWNKGGVDGAFNGLTGGTELIAGLQKLGATNPYAMNAILALSVFGGVVGKGTASDVAMAAEAGLTAYQAYQGISGGAAAAGASTGSSLGPYVAAAAAAYGGYKILSSNMTDEQKAKALRRTTEDSLAAYATFGTTALVQMADRQLFGGQTDKFRDKYEKYASLGGSVIGDKLTTKALGAFSGGTQNKEHQGRNVVRKELKNSGFVDEDWQVTLANGMKANIGLDSKGGEHTFRDPTLLGKGEKNRTLRAYDVDYTNDLDYSANMMTNALMRLKAGGKGTATDQIGGQLANAALSQVGFGKDLTEDNFASVQANARAFFDQNGVKSKEDAYALANQMFAEKRVSEMDLIALHQGINLAFDKDGFNTAQRLLSGRHKGIEVAYDMHPQGPSFHFNGEAPSFTGPQLKIPSGFQGNLKSGVELMEAGQDQTPVSSNFTMYGGPYWGSAASGMYGKALESYKDPYMPQATIGSVAGQTKDLSKEELRARNQNRYGR